MVQAIDMTALKGTITANEKLLVCYFFSSESDACDMFTPELDWIVENNQDVFQDQVAFFKVDVLEEKNKSAVEEYGISCVPHVVLFKGGKPIVSSLGFMAREVLVRFIRENL